MQVASKDMQSSSPTTSQANQLAAYRMRHINNRTTAISTTPKQPEVELHRSASDEAAVPSSSHVDASHKITKNINDYISVVNPKGEMAAKLAAAAPYNFFLTTITAAKQTHREPLSITFQGESIVVVICFPKQLPQTVRFKALQSNDPNLEFHHIIRDQERRLI